MEEDFLAEENGAQASHAGVQLRAAREARGLEIAQVAAETRIPQRHLAAIEAGDYTSLPSRTYAIGFARTYARLVGLDEQAIIDHVRSDLAQGGPRAAAPSGLQPGDPARVPSRGLAWFALLAAIILGAGIFAFYRTYFSPGLGPAPLSTATPTPAAAPRAAAAPAASAPAPASGPVVFTSEEDGTWVRFYDGQGERLFEGVLAKGQSFTVPATAQDPQVRTGRPYALAITIGGRPVPKLAEDVRVIKDVPVSAAALLARPAPAAPATADGPPAATPTTSAPTPSASGPR